MLANLKVGTKLALAFFIEVVLLCVIGLVAYYGMNSMKGEMERSMRNASYMDAAMEMKFAMSQSMLMGMEIFGSDDLGELASARKEFKELVDNYDVLGTALLEGGRDLRWNHLQGE